MQLSHKRNIIRIEWHSMLLNFLYNYRASFYELYVCLSVNTLKNSCDFTSKYTESFDNFKAVDENLG